MELRMGTAYIPSINRTSQEWRGSKVLKCPTTSLTKRGVCTESGTGKLWPAITARPAGVHVLRGLLEARG